MYMVVLHPAARRNMKTLFPAFAEETEQVWFSVKDSDMAFDPGGITVPARPTVIDMNTQKSREQPGHLTIPYAVVDCWFHYESPHDEPKSQIGFAIKESQKIERLGSAES